LNKLIGLVLSGLLTLISLAGCGAAEFELGPLTATPSDVVAGEAFTVNADITNVGGATGTLTATLTLDIKVVEAKEVTIDAGAKVTVSFSCVVDTPGIHTLHLNDLTTTFNALKPASFRVISLSVPPKVGTGETATIVANIMNTGEVSGVYNANLMVNGEELVIKDIMVAPGVTETITLTVPQKKVGTYIVQLGEMTGVMEVVVLPPLLISPEEGAVLDNGRTDGLDDIVWDFNWSDCEGATEYHLYVIGPGAIYPIINVSNISSSSYQDIRYGSYIIERNRYGWTWQVKARVAGQWTEWSEIRTFDVEPLNTDPPL
jgi:predicted small lipoprotein YifL